MSIAGRRTVAVFLLTLSLVSMTGCKKTRSKVAGFFSRFHHRKSISKPNAPDYAGDISDMVSETTLPVLRWPNFADYQGYVQSFYNDRNFELAWSRDYKPTPAAAGFIAAFVNAGAKGLNPEDYDASRWADRVKGLATKDDDAVENFDVAMTVCVMRFVSDLRIGRVNPQHFNFDINVQSKKYDLADYLSDNAVDADDVPKLMTSVEPQSEQYSRTEEALAHYLDLAKQQAAQGTPKLPLVTQKNGIAPGEAYPGAQQLLARLRLEGDTTEASTSPDVYTAQLAEGVKSYQHRHGMTEDGRLTPQTVASLNVPLTDRVIQLQNSLERWRWLPEEYLNAPLIVNLPEFVLRGYTPDHKVDFTMRVVDGQQMNQHATPVFVNKMKYIVFRPYWNVPVDIARKELVPHMQKDKNYLGSHNFEATDGKGNLQSGFSASDVANGHVLVREKPGPKNSLGLIKFMFPNTYDIYLHSTPATELFNRSRRDFSHGCVRVQEPAKLGAWVLQNQQNTNPKSGGGDWTQDKVQAEMNGGQDNHTVALKTPIPIVIFYVTAIAAEDGHIHFFDDIYGYDAEMQKVLSKGPPYPAKAEPVKKANPGDTA